MFNLIRYFIGAFLVLVGFIGAFYIAIWWGIVEPITHICQMIDAHNVTAVAVGKEVIKFFLRGFVAGMFAIVCWFFAYIFIKD